MASRKPNRPVLSMGTRVEWSSTSNGCTRTKTGVVVELVRRGDLPSPAWHERGRAMYGPFRDDGSPVSMWRDHESYIIEVRRTAKAKPRYYWPVVSKLREVANG